MDGLFFDSTRKSFRDKQDDNIVLKYKRIYISTRCIFLIDELYNFTPATEERKMYFVCLSFVTLVKLILQLDERDIKVHTIL